MLALHVVAKQPPVDEETAHLHCNTLALAGGARVSRTVPWSVGLGLDAKRLDEAVFATYYEWKSDLSDEEILEKLLASNLERIQKNGF
jgi:hypothetical protein